MKKLFLTTLLFCCALQPVHGDGASHPQKVVIQFAPQAEQGKGIAAPALPGKQKDEAQYTLKSEVKLVNVFVTVTTSRGEPAENLKKEDFELLEDGAAQTIAVFGRESQLALSIVLAIDASLSTRKDIKLEAASAQRFAHSILRAGDALSLYQFTENVTELLPLTSDLNRIDRAIGRMRIGAATALYDAIYLASQRLVDRKGRKVLVLITDGGDTASKTNYSEAVRAAQEAEAIVYSIIDVPIAADAGRNTGGEHALIQLSTDTGGKHFYAESPGELNKAFRQISDELRTQYLLAYYPSKRLSDSEFRSIRVKVSQDRGPLRVAHRSGYYTSRAR